MTHRPNPALLSEQVSAVSAGSGNGNDAPGAYSSAQPKNASGRVRSRFYRPELDALRFFAFSLVFVDHFWPLFRVRWQAAASTGAFGVPIFFCLSAYLIVTLLFREMESSGTIHVRDFAIRRILRIWPLYFLAIAIGYVAGLLFPELHLTRGAVIALVFLSGNIYVARRTWQALGVLTALWSISVEEQFYLVVPLLTKLGGRKMIAAVCCCALCGSYIAIAVINGGGVIPFVRLWPDSLVQFQFFALGGLIAIATERRIWRAPLGVRAGMVIAGLAVFRVTSMMSGIRGFAAVPTGNVCAGYAALLLGTAMIFLAFLNAEVSIPGPVLYLGKISYGLYVFHGMLIDLALAGPFARYRVLEAIAIPVMTIACAALSYEFFEKPFLRWKGRFETVKTRSA